MFPWTGAVFGVVCLLICAVPAQGVGILLRGKVVMEDGSAPAKGITIERFCIGQGTAIAASTAKGGLYLYPADVDAMQWGNCVLRAVLGGYDSSAVPVSQLNWWSDPNLPAITLRVRDASLGKLNTLTDANIYFEGTSIPANARQPWSNAARAMAKSNWTLAEHQLQVVVKEAPKMAEAWNYLGDAARRLNEYEESAQAYEKAAQLNPKLVAARIGILRSFMDLKKWPEADAAADALIRDKIDAQYPEIYAHQAIARYNKGNMAGAENSAREAIRRDTKHQLPRTEMVMATILESRAEYDSAREHMQRFLELDPRAADAAQIRERMSNLGRAPAPGGSAGNPAAPVIEAINVTVDGAGEAWVPGGMKALARMASMPREPAYDTFFEEYCRAIGREVSVGTAVGIPRYTQGLREFLATVTELIPLGEKRGDTTVVRISAAGAERRQQAQRVLALLGWTLEERDGKVHVEPGYRPEDALLQTVAQALGIDQIAMQEALQSGGEFQFEIVSENARLTGGNLWTQILIQEKVPPGGLAAVFATDTRIAKTCAGLNAMNVSSAEAIMSTVGLRNLAAKNAELLYRYSEAFSITNGRFDVPGGAAAEPAWQKVAGANPRNAPEFYRALAEKDAGRMGAFYWTVASADAAHRQYFTRSPERLERFYAWFRGSREMTNGILQHFPGFQSEFIHAAPLDSAGNIHFPGGQAVWFTGTEIPLDNVSIEALLPVARLERKHGAPLDKSIVELLVRNHTQWAALYPYFESVPDMGREEYAALATFSESMARRPLAERNVVLGEWYALVDLITRGAKAGSLDGAAAAKAFRRVSLELASSDSPAARSAAILRELAGGGDLEEAVSTNLLRLDAERRMRFNRGLEMLRAPRVAESSPADIPTALAAFVYAAALDPGLLVLNEDPGLLRRHRYSIETGPLFVKAELHGAQDARGTHFSGGFTGFEEAAKPLMGGAKAAPRVPIVARTATQAASASSRDDASAVDFRSDTKLVEVYTTVMDKGGHYVDNLTLPQFSIVDGKDPRTIIAFEPQTSDLSVALLLDTTGSMADTIASLKRAAIKLIDSLRQGDSVAVYSFSEQVTELAPYSTDRGITKRAVMNTRPMGNTALFDAIARAGHELTGRSGKKVVIVFTDGRDTSSMLTLEAAIERAKVAGVPVYTIAEGEAIKHPDLIRQLAAISTATGGVPFQVRNPDDMAAVFEKVAEDLSHGYLLYFQPPSGEDRTYHEINVAVGGKQEMKIRAREGYYP